MDPVIRAFDAMADSYDELEPWYEHLYRRLHDILRAELAPPPDVPGPRALDVGCGTGFQTAVLQALGYEAHGVDLAERLLRVARARLRRSMFVCGNAETLPYADATFDAVACCGSTLSFVHRPFQAVREIGRVLRPGGRLLLECEHRWSLDLVWALASAVTGDSLGYGAGIRDAARALVPRRGAVTIPYRLAIDGGQAVTVPLRLFTRGELHHWLRDAGLHVADVRGIHVLTNLIPSPVLHRARLGRRTAALYATLSRLDERLSGWRLTSRLANSLVVIAVKRTPRRATSGRRRPAPP